MNPRPTRTKIVATLGPASANREVLARLMESGLSVVRLNFSHGDHATHKQGLDLVRELAAERDLPIAILGDLCGPKIRLNAVAGEPFRLAAGDVVRFERGAAPCTPQRWTTNFPGFVDQVQAGHRVYIDDGLVRLLATDREPDAIICTCTTGGVVSSRKGINLPDTPLRVPALTEKDRADLAWAIDNGLDFVALSFVRRPDDLTELRELTRARDSDIGVIVKIEKPEALQQLDAILALADGVMVARGDLGVEIDIWRVPLMQKRIVRRARALGKPVIVATQMLQSMIDHPTPTRAEVSDVASAVLDLVDAVMLSAESASGAYPALAVDLMARIAGAAEEFAAAEQPAPEPPDTLPDRPLTAGLARAAVEAARRLHARLIAAWTATGATVRQLAMHRVALPIVGLTYDQRVRRRLNLLHGVIPLHVPPISVPAEMAAVLDRQLIERRLALPGDLVVVITSTRPSERGATDTVLAHRVGRSAL